MRRFFARIRRALDTPAGISLGRMGAQSLSLFTAPIIAQAIGPTGRGMTAAAIAVVTICGVGLGMGVPLAVRRRAVLDDDRRDLVRTARLVALLAIVPAVAIAVGVWMTILHELDTSATVAFFVAMASACLTVSWSTDTQVLVADQRYFRILWLGSIQTVTYFCVILALWLTGNMSVAAVLWAYTSGTVAAFILGRVWVSDRGGKVRGLGSLLRESARLWGSQLAEVANARLDQLLVLPILGAAPAGIYSVAATLGALPVSIGIGLGTASFRGFVRDPSATNIARGVRMAVAVATMLGALVAVASIPGVPILFGDAFRPAVPLVAIALVGGVCVTGTYLCTMALVARNHGLRMTLLQFGGLIVGVALLFPLGHLWSSTGAAIASTAGYATTFFAALLVLGVRPWNAFPRPSDFAAGFRLFLRS